MDDEDEESNHVDGAWCTLLEELLDRVSGGCIQVGGIQGNDLVSEHLLIREDPSSTDAVEDGPGIAHIDCRPVDGLVIGWRLLKEVGHLKSFKSVEDEN